MRSIAVALFFLLTFSCVGQSKVDVKIELISKIGNAPSEWIFKVRILNRQYDKYWIRDTATIKKGLAGSASGEIYAQIYKKNGGHYNWYSNPRHVGDPIPDTTIDQCLNCILLQKGDSIVFTLNLLDRQELEKGNYRVNAVLSTSFGSYKKSGHLGEFKSNNVFFTILNTPQSAL